MPELPEVETFRQGLERLTLDREIQGGEVLRDRPPAGWSDRTIAHPSSIPEFLGALQGCRIRAWQRRGKYLLARLQRQERPAGWLGVHLRMSGQFFWVTPTEPLPKHTRVRLWLAPDRELRFVDQRTFGKLWWVPPDTAIETIITGLATMGPEPLSPEFSTDYLYRTLHRRQRPMKTALLDQTIIAGLGNIYADEALFLSGIHPQQRCCDVPDDRWQALKDAIVRVLQEGLQAGGTSFSTYTSLEGVNGNYGGIAWVYQRTGQPCRQCGTAIARIKLSGRSSHFCPQCQPLI
ncbi:DNA-formamidopyrimidine glycosylase [Roseofilum casamattae]|uniref:Formamidopyrimidine-DNA glycosylase n=1 Tax=Roseofilum casamattae BLCC-M143 TaxID=3022442 RepID=A0ABT7BR66_9CYAN|nr:DNA-formamidopyrimidine glycosylase [Roseofilum casamattae]MDJ1181580.1 DNA-formamidopyrimidine glycosylase [Roseofilum casamattae BLCC-M143]